jgi:hypothetical protein
MIALARLFAADDAFAMAVRTWGFSCAQNLAWGRVCYRKTHLFKVELFSRGSSLGNGLPASGFFELETLLFDLPLGLFLISSPLLNLTFTLCQRLPADLGPAGRLGGSDLPIETCDTGGAAVIPELPTPGSQNGQDLLPHFGVRRGVGSKMLQCIRELPIGEGT